MKKVFSTLLIFCHFQLIAQTAVDSKAVQAVIQKMFDSMRTADTSTLAALFDSSARLQTCLINADGKSELRNETITNFIEAIGWPRNVVYDERIWSYDIRVDGNLASAWTDYTFYLGDKLNHCGVNAFQLFKNDKGQWKITQITDTRRKTNCLAEAPQNEKAIHLLLDKWHHAAAIADEEAFFGSMTSEAIYLGTDASERWLRDEMREWSKQYFERDTAWAFTPRNRQVYLSENENLAWFEELLDTWMGECRGSGVLKKTEDGWKIAHYNLAVTVPNELINGFIELVKQTNAPSKK